MLTLTHQHCLNHSAREAVAQCPECRHYFCRECITEHDDRILCAACLRQISSRTAKGPPPLRVVGRAGLSLLGVLTAVVFFYWIGQILLLVPTSFHDGTMWKSDWSWRE
jgi:hypothetical protein